MLTITETKGSDRFFADSADSKHREHDFDFDPITH